MLTSQKKVFGSEAPYLQTIYAILVLLLCVFSEYFDRDFAFLTPILYTILHLFFLVFHTLVPSFYSIEGNGQKIASYFFRFGLGLTVTISYVFYYSIYFVTGSTVINGYPFIGYIGVTILGFGLILTTIGYILIFVLWEIYFRLIVGLMFNSFGERCKKINAFKLPPTSTNAEEKVEIPDEFYDLLDNAKWFAKNEFFLVPCLSASLSNKGMRKYIDEIVKAIPLLKVEFSSRVYSKIALYYIFHKSLFFFSKKT